MDNFFICLRKPSWINTKNSKINSRGHNLEIWWKICSSDWSLFRFSPAFSADSALAEPSLLSVGFRVKEILDCQDVFGSSWSFLNPTWTVGADNKNDLGSSLVDHDHGSLFGRFHSQVSLSHSGLGIQNLNLFVFVLKIRPDPCLVRDPLHRTRRRKVLVRDRSPPPPQNHHCNPRQPVQPARTDHSILTPCSYLSV